MKKFAFDTKEQYLSIIQAWKDSWHDKNFRSYGFTAEHFALYAIIRGKDPKKCFATPEQQSQEKLAAQGKDGWETYHHCMNVIMRGYRDQHLLEPFQGKLTEDDLAKVRETWKKAA